MTVKTTVIINSLDDSFKPYFATKVTETRNIIDALAFEQAVDHQQAVAFGKTIARPISGDRALILETLLGHIRYAFQHRHVTQYHGNVKCLDELRCYVKNFRRHIEAYS